MRIWAGIFAAAAALVAPATGWAQAYPARPVKVVMIIETMPSAGRKMM